MKVHFFNRPGRALWLSLLLLVIMLPATATTVFHTPGSGKAPFAPVAFREGEPFVPDQPLLRVDFINVKIGDAILLRAGDQSMMIDGGTRGKADMLELFFADQGITDFTYYFNTHAHDDHIEASTCLVQRGYPTTCYLSKYPDTARGPWLDELFSALKKKGIPHRQVLPGEQLDFAGARLTFLENTREGAKAGVNARSMMLHVRFGERSLLLTADVTGNSLLELLQDYPELMDVDIMKSPHHGYNRLHQQFLDCAAPELMVITSNTVVKNNLADQLKLLGMPHYFISMGTVSLVTDGQTWQVSQHPNN
ncbi:MAG: MBL fold metallo-hydrolase [Clostridiales bacterium]|nr:MBL fold metallo-hydrolase [Clostridiales bacterium]